MNENKVSVTLTSDEVERLSVALSELRHSVNNQLSVMIAAIELIRRRPETCERMVENLAAQIPKIQEGITRFSGMMQKSLSAGGASSGSGATPG